MVENIKEALQKAIRMEEEGKQFCLKVAKEAKNLLVKRVFEQLAQEEDLHIKKINEVYHLLKEDKPWELTALKLRTDLLYDPVLNHHKIRIERRGGTL